MAYEILKPKTDILFKMIFADENNGDMLKRFLSDTLDIPYDEISDIQIENSEIPPDNIGGKLSRMDIRMTVGDRAIDVEVQLRNKGDFVERSLFYWAKLYSRDLNSGDSYSELRKGIVLNLIDFILFDDTDEFYSKFLPLEEKRHTLLSDKMEIHFYELPKVSMKEGANEPKKMWMQFMNADSEEDLIMLGRTEIPEIKKGVNIIKDLSADAILRERIRAREDAERDYYSAMASAEKIGLSRGMKQGMAQGMAQGRSDLLSQLLAAGAIDKNTFDKFSE